MAQGGLTYKFRTADILSKIIIINIVLFVGIFVGAALFQKKPMDLVHWFVLPNSFNRFITQPWSIVTYGFLHAGFWHILFNMLWLFVFGKYVLNLFSEKRFLTLYFLGTICGGLFYMISYNVFPAFYGINGNLIGASASVMAIMAFAATYSPDAPIRILVINLKLWHVALFFVLLDLLSLATMSNPGGMIAHLGGALFGYIYARQLMQGNDLGRWFEALMEGVANLFKPQKKKPFKKFTEIVQHNPLQVVLRVQ